MRHLVSRRSPPLAVNPKVCGGGISPYFHSHFFEVRSWRFRSPAGSCLARERSQAPSPEDLVAQEGRWSGPRHTCPRLGCTAPTLAPPASPARLYQPVDLPGLCLPSWTVALPHMPSFPPLPGTPAVCRSPPQGHFLLPSLPSRAPHRDWPGIRLFPGLCGLDGAPLPECCFSVTCRPGGAGARTAVASAFTCAPEAGLSPGTIMSPRLLATPAERWRPHSLLELCSWGLQLPGVAINKELRN